jgi:N-acetylmuramic acid 6-phosphate etherase
MKAGSAQKMTLNMLSTSVMIKLGHVVGNKMIDMKISNSKLKNRGIEMIINQCKVSKEKAISLLESNGNVRKSIKKFNETK